MEIEGIKAKIEIELKKRSGVYWLRESTHRVKSRVSEAWKRFAVIYDENGALDYVACKMCYQVSHYLIFKMVILKYILYYKLNDNL